MSAFDPKRTWDNLNAAAMPSQNLAVSPKIGPCIVMSNW